MSWAQFNDIALDFTQPWADGNKINQSDLYVTGFDGGSPTTTSVKPTNYMACINMKYHGNQYGVYGGSVKVPVKAGKYRIGLGTTDYGGEVNISDGTKVIATINNKGDKFFYDKTNIATGVVNVTSVCELEIYATNAGNTYFPYISVSEVKETKFQDFSISFIKPWAAANINQNAVASSYYVTSVDDDVPTLSVDLPSSYIAHFLGYYKDATYGLYYNAKIKVPVTAGKYQIGIGMSDYGGDVNISDGSKVLTIINSNGSEKFAENSENIAKGEVNVTSDCILEISAPDNPNVCYPYIQVKRLGDADEALETYYVSYYDTNGKFIGEEEVEEFSQLTYKYGARDVTVPSGKKFRGWYDGNTASAKLVPEGTLIQKNTKLYAKATDIEVATTTSSHVYDLTNANWYQNEHDLIKITNGKYYNNHAWDIAAGGTIKLKIAGDAVVTLNRCQYGSGTSIVVTDASNREIATLGAKAAVDGGSASFKYVGKATTLTLTFASQTYFHGLSVQHVKNVPFEPFKIDFRSNIYTVLLPKELPENVTVVSGSFDDNGSGDFNQHGYKNAVLKVSVDRPVKFTIGTCKYTDKATVSVDGEPAIEINTKAGCDNVGVGSGYNENVTYIYKGTEPAMLLFNLGAYCPYFFAEEWSGVEYDEATKTYNVAAGNVAQLKDAISGANGTGDVTIYLPNGTYDLGSDFNTEVRANNIAIIGESRDGVIIKNAPLHEGLWTTATLKNTSTGLYLQDLTLECNATYGSGTDGIYAERSVALWDCGTKTICKNVYLKGKQDTYYSNGAEGMIAYFEGGKIEGAVDFVCGSGNVLFNSVTLNVIATEHTQSGGCIAAPTTYNSENGYVFANCLITADGFQQGTYYLARGWQNSPAAIFVLTKFAANPSSKYWGANINALTSRRFAAYSTGAQNDSNTTPISKASLTGFASGWDPAEIISQHSPIKTNAAGWASYTAFTDVYIKGSDVKAYTAIQINKNSVLLKTIDDKVIPAGTAVFVKGAEKTAYYVNGALVSSLIEKNYLKPVLFDTPLTSGQNAFVIGTRDGVCGLYLVNSDIVVPAGKCYLDAGEASLVLAKDELQFVFYDSEATGINNIDANTDADSFRYNLSGQKVGNGYKGIVVRKDGKKYMAK